MSERGFTPRRRLRLSPTGWARVILTTIAGTVFCVAAALFVDSFNFHNLSEAAIRRAVLVDIALPMGLAAPLLFLLTYKMRELAIAYAELLVVATTDGLTQIPNRVAFTTRAEAFLNRKSERPCAGALLIVDADDFKSINDELGHQRGDLALRMMADVMMGELRSGDIVGRIGGEEFGILLPGADIAEANSAAERIRAAIGTIEFTTMGDAWPLAASIGGVTFEEWASYDKLFAAADANLYLAKAGGRDQVRMGAFKARSSGDLSPTPFPRRRRQRDDDFHVTSETPS
ncbi:diguanylate cyclase [Aurantimonas endophytica]|nr:diguanylate cyclase [Aurantimonas endophytica]